MTGLADVDGFKIAFETGFRPQKEYKRGGPFNLLRPWEEHGELGGGEHNPIPRHRYFSRFYERQRDFLTSLLFILKQV